MLKRQPLFLCFLQPKQEVNSNVNSEKNEKVHKKDLKKVEVWFTMELSGEKW